MVRCIAWEDHRFAAVLSGKRSLDLRGLRMGTEPNARGLTLDQVGRTIECWPVILLLLPFCEV